MADFSLSFEDGVAMLAGPLTVAELGGAERGLRQRMSAQVPEVIDLSGVTRLDASGAWLLLDLQRSLPGEIELRPGDEDQRALVELVAGRIPEKASVRKRRDPMLVRIGRRSVEEYREVNRFLTFLGRVAASLGRAIGARGRFYWREIIHVMETAGANAIPIVGLLALLVGVVIAYQGVVQLSRYGATVFVVDLVAISILRELAPLITAIIVAGRTGSAFTAEIGAMKITEEIDALRVLGIGPLELLVVPKMIALIIVLPLLTVFADICGLLGGMAMAHIYGDVSARVFVDQLPEAVDLSTLLTGLGKTPVFAAIIAAVGCHQGFQVGQGADSVGRQTTVSVVQSIFMVIVVDAVFSIVFSTLDL